VPARRRGARDLVREAIEARIGSDTGGELVVVKAENPQEAAAMARATLEKITAATLARLGLDTWPANVEEPLVIAITKLPPRLAVPLPPARAIPAQECPSDALCASESAAIDLDGEPSDAPAQTPAEHVWPWNRPTPEPPEPLEPQATFYLTGGDTGVEMVEVTVGRNVWTREATDDDRAHWSREYAEYCRTTPKAYGHKRALVFKSLNNLRSDRV
jgi:hypothetical protein